MPSCCVPWRPVDGHSVSPTAHNVAPTVRTDGSTSHPVVRFASCAGLRGGVDQPGTSALLGALLSGDWAVTAASSTTSRRAASGVVAAYLQMHLERDLRSLPIADRAWLSELSVKLTSDEGCGRMTTQPRLTPAAPPRPADRRPGPASRGIGHGRQRPVGQERGLPVQLATRPVRRACWTAYMGRWRWESHGCPRTPSVRRTGDGPGGGSLSWGSTATSSAVVVTR